MNRTLLFSFIFTFLTLSHAAEFPTEALNSYKSMHLALAHDNPTESQVGSRTMGISLKTWIAANPEHSLMSIIKKWQTANDAYGPLSSIDGMRIQFGKISEQVVDYVRKTPKLHTQFQLFFCPMFPQGYAYWVQPQGEKLMNPYWGKKMFSCGVTKQFISK